MRQDHAPQDVPKIRHHLRLPAALSRKVVQIARAGAWSVSEALRILVEYAIERLEADGYERPDPPEKRSMNKYDAKSAGLTVIRRRPEQRIPEDGPELDESS